MDRIPPGALIIALLTIIYAAVFHLWKGRKWSDLAVYLVAALVGMVLGQLLGPLLGLNLLRLGQVYLLEGTVLAWLFMFAVAWVKG